MLKLNLPPAETTGFVDKLFECLTTKNYLGNPPAKEVPKEETRYPGQKSEGKEEVKFCSLHCNCS